MAIVIKGGDVVTPAGRRRRDVRIVGDRIDAVEDELPAEPGDEVVDAGGLLVLPGIIDVHTHFSLSSGEWSALDDFRTGSQSAAAGGVTTYVNFAPQERRQSLVEAMEREREKAEGHSVVDFSLHVCFGTPGPRWEQELGELVERGVTSLKIFTTYTNTIYYTRDWDWFRLMERSGAAGIIVQVHAENDDILRGRMEELVAAGQTSYAYHGTARPEAAEVEAVGRAITFARETGSPVYLVHLSTPDSVALVNEARAAGLPVYGEVCTQHVTLDESVYAGPEAIRYVCTPPMRAAETVERLTAAVAAGHVDAMGSDHCGYGLAQRPPELGFPDVAPGIPGVETLWPAVYTALVARSGMPVEQAVDLVTRRPAEIFGLAPRKGSIAIGADADVVLYDPAPVAPLDETALHSAAGYSPWHGYEIHGRVVRTISRGRTVFAEGELSDDFDHGRFVECRPFERERVDAALAPLAAVG